MASPLGRAEQNIQNDDDHEHLPPRLSTFLIRVFVFSPPARSYPRVRLASRGPTGHPHSHPRPYSPTPLCVVVCRVICKPKPDETLSLGKGHKAQWASVTWGPFRRSRSDASVVRFWFAARFAYLKLRPAPSRPPLSRGPSKF